MSLLQSLVSGKLASSIWRKETSRFLPASAPQDAHDAVKNRLGWLDAPEAMLGRLAELEDVRRAAAAEGLRDVCLLGMGGSSLCAEVLRETRPGGAPPDASLIVVDTTDERAIDQVAASLNPAKTLFVVASKSGTTTEVRDLEGYFWSWATRAVGASAGRHFIAITDPGTPLVAHAAERQYRHTFINSPDIGGRYSALSLFGLVPAALLGLDVKALLDAGRAMAGPCRRDASDNPGLALGAFMAESAGAGRDKLTIVLPPDLAPLGQWIEQLIAESTGKNGTGILPVVDEPVGAAADYGEDRAFVIVQSARTPDLGRTASALAAAGHPVFQCEAAPEGLGAEFFRWEFATAGAGACLRINPFDEPNVKEAKRRTQELLNRYRTTGALTVEPSLKPIDGVAGCLSREHRGTSPGRSGHHRYVALLDYLPTDRTRMSTVSRLRQRIRGVSHAAVTHGSGPRYLHSTGQYHKGGPNTGLFVLLTAADEIATPVPGRDYTFSVLKQAQALGDFNALGDAGRDVVHLHFGNPAADFSSAMEHVLWNRAWPS